MNSSPRASPNRWSFPIEYVVLSVLAMVVLSPFLDQFLFSLTYRGPARRAQAKSDEVNIVGAIKAYYTEYGKYPLGANAAPPGSKPGVFIFGQSPTSPTLGSGVSNSQLFDILRNIDSTGATPPGQPNPYNPRAIVFFDGKTATDGEHPRAGFVPSYAKSPLHPGAYMDPWGTEYFIVIDPNSNAGLMSLPYKDFQGIKAPTISVGVFSLGKDHKLGNAGDGSYKNPTTGDTSDDIISWQ